MAWATMIADDGSVVAMLEMWRRPVLRVVPRWLLATQQSGAALRSVVKYQTPERCTGGLKMH